MGKREYSKVKGFLNSSRKVEIMQFPKHGMSEFPYCGWETTNIPMRMRNHKHSKVMGFLHISREAGIHTIPKPWNESIPILQNKHDKTQAILWFRSVLQILLYLSDLNSCNHHCQGSYKFP